jgi:4-amino-4-deoxy-L-arabinose transferase-like glycosyltransferase
MIAQFFTDFAALFVVTDPRASVERYGGQGTRLTTALLVLVVLAGAVVRFWGLGSVGLHGDEKTMALPVMNLVEHGSPLMPSGMFYPRAVGQLYLMAASVMAFGHSEWALRLPSALCGVLLIILSWKVGGRFLAPPWNLGLTAAVAFLPSFIEDAQTARMYVFLVTCIAGYMAFVFAWERSGRASYLVAAVVTMLVGLQFHTLAIFAAFLVFVPGLLQGDSRKFSMGVLAFAAMVAAFAAIDAWIGSEYPQSVQSNSGAVTNGPHAVVVIPHLKHLWLLVAALPALAFSLWVFARRGVAAPLLLAAALVAEVASDWHLALLLTVAALVFGRRAGALSRPRLALLCAVSVALAVGETTFLVQHAAGSPKQVAGVMLGWPSVWPFISIADYSMIAMLAVVGSLACGSWLLAHRKPVPDHLLLAVLGVWVPLLVIGLMKWNIPSRYAAAQIMPLLVAAFAAAQWAAEWIFRRRTLTDGSGVPARIASASAAGAVSPWASLAAVLVCVLVANPMRVAAALDSGYANHPDHKGAAEFVAALHPGPRDIIVAEDVLQQTYYLGHVDYWLVNKQVAAPFMHRVNGRWLDFYTDTPLIGTGAELERLVDESHRGAIYVIGSGENEEDGRRLMRAFGISEELNSPSFHLVYRGRDGFTQVWKVDAQPASVARGQ